MSEILIVDPSPLCQELLPPALEQVNYPTRACTAANAIQLISLARPNLVILETSDCAGSKLLHILRTEKQYMDLPLLVLTDQTSREAILHAARLGVREYMLKQRFSKVELLSRIRKYVMPEAGATSTTPPAVAVAAAPPRLSSPLPASTSLEEDVNAIRHAAEAAGISLLTREKMLDRLEKASFKTLPGVVAELMALVNSPQGTVVDVASTLRRDPVLSTRVLSVANSAAFTTQRSKVSTIEDAVKKIGLMGVRKLVAAVGIFEIIADDRGGESLLGSWQHSLAVAALMEKLTPQHESAPPGVAYLVGLCHDMADIVLRQHFHEEYGRVLDLTHRTGRPQRRVESAVFGMPYSELVSLLFSRLGLPGVVSAPIQEFFERGVYRQAVGSGSVLGRTLRIANICAHGLMLAPSLDEAVLPLSRIECRNTFGEQIPEFDAELLRADALSSAAALAGLPESQVALASQPPIPKSRSRICYVRNREYAELDPLDTLLRLSTKQVHLREVLPTHPSELADVDALVVAASRSDTNDQIMRMADQLAQLTRGKPLPILLLAGGQTPPTTTCPAHIRMQRLPISIEGVGSFLQKSSTTLEKRAA